MQKKRNSSKKRNVWGAWNKININSGLMLRYPSKSEKEKGYMSDYLYPFLVVDEQETLQ